MAFTLCGSCGFELDGVLCAELCRPQAELEKARLSCPACSGRLFLTTEIGIEVLNCASCGALVADHLYVGQSHTLVSPQWDGAGEACDARYFDITALGQNGVVRRHGWFNPGTRKVVQTG